MSESCVQGEDFTSDSDLFPGSTVFHAGKLPDPSTGSGTPLVVFQEPVSAVCSIGEASAGQAMPEPEEQPTNGGHECIPKGTDDNSAEDRKLFVGGLSWETKEPQLVEYFQNFGEVESVNLKLDPVTGRSRCFAFLVFKHASFVDKVLAGGEHAINSKKVDVKRAKAKPGKIFVGGLVPELEDDKIKGYFTQYGTITGFEMPFDKVKNQRKNFCFITFEREETMKELLKTPKQMIGDVEVDVKKATPKTNFRGVLGSETDFYGQMDYYYGYPEYYGWGGANYGGGKAQGGSRGTSRSAPY